MIPSIPLAKYINKNWVANNKIIEKIKDSFILFFFYEIIIIGTIKKNDTAKTAR